MNSGNSLSISAKSIKETGFSLVELMVTLAIASILLGASLAVINSYIPNEDVRLMAHQVQSSLLMARSEAVKRGSNAYLTPATTGYQDGWIVSTSAGRSYDNCIVTTPPDDCIYVFQNDRPVLLAGLTAQVAYNRQGRIPIGDNITIEVCDDDQSSFVTKRTIQVSSNGFPKIINDGNCTP